jgi:GTP-binding protein LepA
MAVRTAFWQRSVNGFISFNRYRNLHNSSQIPNNRQPIWSQKLFSSSGSTAKSSRSTPRFISILEDLAILKEIPLQDVRNFCFIAHVDHGKSSLSSRILELTGNQGPEAQALAWKIAQGLAAGDAPVNPDAANREKIELLDSLAVEQQRGITVKASTATMLYQHDSAVGPRGTLLLNMYDTPGHVDFGREVIRSLCFVQGAVLLLDATQGIQAQTWSVYEKAQSLPHPPEILLALTKIDLENARPVHVALTACDWLNWDDPDTIIPTSARNRVGIQQVLDAVCAKVPAPTPIDDDNDTLRAQVVDSWYDSRGVNCLVQIVSGEMKESDRISIVGDNMAQALSYSVQEIGLLLPKACRTGTLQRGQMGYCRFGLRDPRQAMPGTMLILNKDCNKQLLLPSIPKETETRSVLYASVHPQDVSGFDDLCNAVNRLALNDTGLEVQKTSSVGGGEGGGPFLGPGLRVGFQGLLHVEVFQQRLQDEFGIEAIVTPPKVPYTITYLANKRSNLEESYTEVVEDLRNWPEPGVKVKIMEPIVDVRIIARVEDAGGVMDLVQRKRGTELRTKPIDEEKWLFTARVPWAEVVIDFHDQLKNITAGYGSLDTSEADPPLAEGALSKVDIMLNGEVVEPLAFVCHRDNAQGEARKVAQKLQGVLPRQQFVTAIQAKADGKIIASERIKAFRKDVLTKSGKTVGGGDQTRKMKLLEKQKKGKKRMQDSGKVKLSQAAFNSVISRAS